MHKHCPPSNIRRGHAPYGKSILYNSDLVKSHAADWLGGAAHRAVMLELETAPKPGLVDRLSSGCHDDMHFGTFVRSANALLPYWRRQAAIGLRSIRPKDAMPELRAIGREMEAAMLAATDGINTHKGLIYHLSLLLYGAGTLAAREERLTPETLLRQASLPVSGSIEKELRALRGKDERALSNGERLFLRHGVTGARGEAEKGFPSAGIGTERLVSALAAGASLNDASLAALLSLMETCEDSNVIHRGGYNFWSGRYKTLAAKANRDFTPLAPDYAILKQLEEAFLPLRISPGGAADLLCCSLFVNIVTSPTCQH